MNIFNQECQVQVMTTNAVYTGNHTNTGLCVFEVQIRKWYVQTMTSGHYFRFLPHTVTSSKTSFPRQKKERLRQSLVLRLQICSLLFLCSKFWKTTTLQNNSNNLQEVKYCKFEWDLRDLTVQSQVCQKSPRILHVINSHF